MHDQVTETLKELKRSHKLNVCEGVCYGDVSIIRKDSLAFNTVGNFSSRGIHLCTMLLCG